MNNYKNTTKKQLIESLELEKKRCELVEIALSNAKYEVSVMREERDQAIEDYHTDQGTIEELKAQVYMLERSILRLTEEETVRQECEIE